MDIDSPPAALPDSLSPPSHSSHSHHHTHLNLPSFSASFPLPFRVLFLVGFAQLLWATNLHILHLIGLDTSWILDFRDAESIDDIGLGQIGTDDVGDEPRTPVTLQSRRPKSSSLYGPVYKLFGLYTCWVGGGWLVFRALTGGDALEMERYRGLVAIIAVGSIVGAVTPWRGVGWRDRLAMRRAIRRIMLPSLDSPIYFCDVILADIFTSFAKVLGDLWISACQLWYGNITQGRVAQTGVANYITLTMVCLPYMMRFRQCVLESYQTGWTSTRPLFNAMKYFSAFPVILLSAAQKNVVVEVAAIKGVTVNEIAESDNRWFGEHRLFRLWLLAVVVNSMYSFWWDVEMDWGLALCEVDTWLPKKEGEVDPDHPSRRIPDLTLYGRAKRLLCRNSTAQSSHQRSPMPSRSPSSSELNLHSHSLSHGHGQIRPRSQSQPQSYHIGSSPTSLNSPFFAFGLRQTLLLPDPLVYHLFAMIDLVLRFTWSLKLSSHLHTISEIESGVFIMEALELVRRWMWVFIRVEWEAVKKGQARATGANGQVIWENKEEP